MLYIVDSCNNTQDIYYERIITFIIFKLVELYIYILILSHIKFNILLFIIYSKTLI